MGPGKRPGREHSPRKWVRAKEVMSERRRFPGALGGISFLILQLLLLHSSLMAAQEPAATAPADKQEQTAAAAPVAARAQGAAGIAPSELATRDTSATFKVRVNLVQVRVVVRDAGGAPVENLQKEDFELF